MKISIKASVIIDDAKHIVFAIDDVAEVAKAIAAAHPADASPLGILSTISDAIESILEQAADSDLIEINAENVAALLGK